MDCAAWRLPGKAVERNSSDSSLTFLGIFDSKESERPRAPQKGTQSSRVNTFICPALGLLEMGL